MVNYMIIVHCKLDNRWLASHQLIISLDLVQRLNIIHKVLNFFHRNSLAKHDEIDKGGEEETEYCICLTVV